MGRGVLLGKRRNESEMKGRETTGEDITKEREERRGVRDNREVSGANERDAALPDQLSLHDLR